MTSRAGMVSVTAGAANVLARLGKARRGCKKCKMRLPAYPGRYPKSCPKCGAELQEVSESIGSGVPYESRIPVIRELLGRGRPDVCEAEGAADAVVVSNLDVAEVVRGGVLGLFRIFEHAEGDVLFRCDGPAEPVLFAVMESDSVRFFATNEPTSLIGFDPREDMVEDGFWGRDGSWSDLDEAGNTRNSTASKRDPGRGSYQTHGGFRFTVGSRKKRRSSGSVAGDLQRRRAARSREMKVGSALKKVQRAKEYHRSSAGMEMHRRLGDYNRGKRDEENSSLRKMLDAAKAKYLGEETGFVSSVEPQPTSEDVFENILRRLIYMESLDVLTDVEFDDSGALYLYFDPMLGRAEIEEIVTHLNSGKISNQGDAALAATPDSSIQGEGDPSDWWVVFVATSAGSGVDFSNESPDAGFEDTPRVSKTVSMSNKGVDGIAAEVDTDDLLRDLGEARNRAETIRWLWGLLQ